MWDSDFDMDKEIAEIQQAATAVKDIQPTKADALSAASRITLWTKAGFGYRRQTLTLKFYRC